MTKRKMTHLGKMLEMIEHDAAMVRDLDRIMRNVENPRSLTEEQFVEVGRAMRLYFGSYLTSHTPNGSDNTSYRLWIGRPNISHSGHPNWNDMGIAEICKPRNDPQMYETITGRRPVESGVLTDVEVVQSPRGGGFCDESRIYHLRYERPKSEK